MAALLIKQLNDQITFMVEEIKGNGKFREIVFSGFSFGVTFSREPIFGKNYFQTGKVISSVGKNPPLFVGDEIKLFTHDDGRLFLKIKTDNIPPEELVKRFMRTGEIEEAKRIFFQKKALCDLIPILGFLTLIPTAFYFAVGLNERAFLSGITFIVSMTTLVILARIKNKQIQGILD